MLKNEDYTNFDNCLLEIQSMLDGEEYLDNQYAEYSSYFAIRKDMLENNKNYSELSTAQQDVLLGLADNGNFFPAAYARALLLKENAEYEYDEPIILPEVSSSRKRNPALSNENTKTYKFEVYPNPAYDYVIVDYELKIEDNNAFVQISDNTGRIINTITLNNTAGQKVVNCKGMTSGLYNFVLKTNIKVLETKRISINN
ncbi:MAG: T9SS type A sorting domain-containing protein [Saprospiraceae bacterium]|nr:T9SS type A sorting domain-containing protein [Saprospiraceae bacterium]